MDFPAHPEPRYLDRVSATRTSLFAFNGPSKVIVCSPSSEKLITALTVPAAEGSNATFPSVGIIRDSTQGDQSDVTTDSAASAEKPGSQSRIENKLQNI